MILCDIFRRPESPVFLVILAVAACASNSSCSQKSTGVERHDALFRVGHDGGEIEAGRDVRGMGTRAAPVRSEICNGETGMQLRVYVGIGLSDGEMGAEIEAENGVRSFFVDGGCVAWAGGGWAEDRLGRARPWRSARLTSQQKDALEAALGFATFDHVADCQSQSGLFSHSVRVMQRRQAGYLCRTRGPQFDKTWELVTSIALAISNTGAPLTGPIRLAAKEIENPEASFYPGPVPWPFDKKLDDFLYDQTKAGRRYPTGNGLLVSDLEEAKKLRLLQANHLAAIDSHPERPPSALKVTNGTTIAAVYLRDALPFEDEFGILSFAVVP